MSAFFRPYRTLIRGILVQTSALSVGGCPGPESTPEECYRDGAGRLTIPGTSLAGAMIETAARLFPNLIGPNLKKTLLEGKITGKRPFLPPQRHPSEQEEDFFQSVWRFSNAHPVDENLHTEWRQGVGIRQATGASATEKRALYDFECVPIGARWKFLLEINTHQGGQEAEALAILTLNEWVGGRCWLGRGSARGPGWFRLDQVEILRLPSSQEFLELWPDATTTPWDAFDGVSKKCSDKPTWNSAVQQAWTIVKQRQWQLGQWHYLIIPVRIPVGLAPDGYGLNPLHVGGHPAGQWEMNIPGLLQPLSAAGPDWRGEQFQPPDAPFVATKPISSPTSPSQPQWQPFLPGSSLRGPLRHTVSRLARALGRQVADPNAPPATDPEAQRFRTALKEKQKTQAHLADEVVRQLADPVTQIFGLEECCSRILISDALLCPPDPGTSCSTKPSFVLVRTEHHAEDEFTAGVYGTGKFDCDLLVAGTFQFQIVLEAPSLMELHKMVQWLAPALELARLGHLPIGGAKWQGAGWIPWQIGPMQIVRIGQQPVGESSTDPQTALFDLPIASRWTCFFQQFAGGN
ncbi:MAG: RAMP superfamily CRISPR-associated protein [Thermoguttaceae bacterium]|nr:RAMP superfamily CRISPR-associated protein [Thermoguttaceae bacterium]MDW8037105.1 RAMP superfamily CRISPR-associated protein [Thermoguttaceae bacterium]